MTAEKIAAVVHLLALLAAIGSMALVLYHCWGMISHLRPDRSLLANLLGAFALLPGSLYDAEGLRHRVHGAVAGGLRRSRVNSFSDSFLPRWRCQ